MDAKIIRFTVFDFLQVLTHTFKLSIVARQALLIPKKIAAFALGSEAFITKLINMLFGSNYRSLIQLYFSRKKEQRKKVHHYSKKPMIFFYFILCCLSSSDLTDINY